MGQELITTPFKEPTAPRFEIQPGHTIAEILALAAVPETIWDNIAISVNGADLKPDQWATFTPTETDVVRIFVIPLGGDDSKAILRMVATIVIAVVATIYAGPAAAAAWGKVAGFAVQAGVTIIGTLAVNALIPPPKLPGRAEGSAQANSYFITGQANRARFYELVPIVYGTHKMVANLATSVDVLNAGTSSIFSAAYDFGLGGCVLSDIKAGDTDLESFDGAIRTLERVPAHIDPTKPELGLKPVGLQLVHFPTKHTELSIGLEDRDDSDWATTGADSSAAVVEIAFPSGLVEFGETDGAERKASVNFELEYRVTGETAWNNPPGATTGYARDHLSIIMSVPPDPDEPGVLTGDFYTSHPSVGQLDVVWITLSFNGRGYYLPGTALNIIQFFDADTGARLAAADVTIEPSPVNALGYPFVHPTANDGVMYMNAAEKGLRYYFEMKFRPGYVGRVYIQTNTNSFYRDELGNDVWGSYIITGAIMNVDLGGTAPPPPGGIPSSRYDETPGHETYLVVPQRKHSLDTSNNWQTLSGSVLWIDGVSTAILISQVPDHQGEYVKTGDEWNVAGYNHREAYYALLYDAKMLPGSGLVYEPEPPEWPGVPGYYHSFTVTGDRAQPGIVSILLPFPRAGQYDIKLTRITVKPNTNRRVNRASWIKLISRGATIDSDPYTLLNLRKQHTLMEASFEASENISGNVQQVSALVSQRIRKHTTFGWLTPQVTSNPVWIVLDILTGYSIQNHQDVPKDYRFDGGWIKDHKINFASFVALANHCDETVNYNDYDGRTKPRKRYECNLLLASDAPIIETCQSILSMCRAQLILDQQGKISVLRDEIQTTPRQLFTPQNSWNFSGTRAFQEIPHAFHVSFTSPELGYQRGTITVFRPGYDVNTAELFEDLDTFGITNWHQAAQYGVYMMAQALIRSEVYTLECDTENLVCTRGDLVWIQNDVPLLGGTACIAKEDQVATRVYVDQDLGTFAGNGGYTWRGSDGTIIPGAVKAWGPDWFETNTQVGIKKGDLVVVGVYKPPQSIVTDPYIITQIRPKQDLTAELTLVRYDEDVYKTDFGTFPTWNPSFGEAPTEQTSLRISNIRGIAGLIYKDRQPFSTTELTWQVTPLANAARCAAIEIDYRRQIVSTTRQLIQLDGDERTWTHEYSARDLDWGPGTYIITPISNLGFRGQANSVYVGQVVDKIPPHDPENFKAEYLTDGTTRLTWDKNTQDPDLAGYTIVSGSLANPVPVAQVDHNTHQVIVPGMAETEYFLTATDTSGNQSITVSAVLVHTTPQTPGNFQIHINGQNGLLTWDLLPDPFVNQYLVRYNPDPTEVDPTAPGTIDLGQVDGNTNSMAVDPQTGSYFLVAKNIFNKEATPARTSTTIPGLVATSVVAAQALEHHGRYPYSNITLTWALTGDPASVKEFRVFFRDANNVEHSIATLAPDQRTASALFDILRDPDKNTGEFIVQPVGIYGQLGVQGVAPFIIIQDTARPAPPQKFFANVSGHQVELNWLVSISNDIDHYEISYSPKVTGVTWDESESLGRTDHLTTNFMANARTGTFLAAAFDTSGNRSDAVLQRTTVNELPDINVVETIDEQTTDWPGTVSGFIKVTDPALPAHGRILVTKAPTGPDGYAESVYTFDRVIDLGSVYEARITSYLDARVTTSYAGVSPNADAWVEYRTSDHSVVIADWPTLDDPIADPISGAGGAGWSEWRRFYSTDITAQHIQFRIVARSYDSITKLGMYSGLVEIDMPDRVWSKADIVVPVGGVTVVFDPEFKAVKAIAVSIDGNEDPVVAEVTAKTPVNFRVELKHSQTHASVAGRVDVIATGYGRKQTTSI